MRRDSMSAVSKMRLASREKGRSRGASRRVRRACSASSASRALSSWGEGRCVCVWGGGGGGSERQRQATRQAAETTRLTEMPVPRKAARGPWSSAIRPMRMCSVLTCGGGSCSPTATRHPPPPPPATSRAHLWRLQPPRLLLRQHHRLDAPLRELFKQRAHHQGTPRARGCRAPRPLFKPGTPSPETVAPLQHRGGSHAAAGGGAPRGRGQGRAEGAGAMRGQRAAADRGHGGGGGGAGGESGCAGRRAGCVGKGGAAGAARSAHVRGGGGARIGGRPATHHLHTPPSPAAAALWWCWCAVRAPPPPSEGAASRSSLHATPRHHTASSLTHRHTHRQAGRQAGAHAVHTQSRAWENKDADSTPAAPSRPNCKRALGGRECDQQARCKPPATCKPIAPCGGLIKRERQHRHHKRRQQRRAHAQHQQRRAHALQRAPLQPRCQLGQTVRGGAPHGPQRTLQAGAGARHQRPVAVACRHQGGDRAMVLMLMGIPSLILIIGV